MHGFQLLTGRFNHFFLGSAHAPSYKEDDERDVDDEQQRSHRRDGDDDNPGQVAILKDGRLSLVGVACGRASPRSHTDTQTHSPAFCFFMWRRRR